METTKQKSIFSKPWVQSVTGSIGIALMLTGFIIWRSVSSRVSVDMASIAAPLINIGPQTEGILTQVYVQAGDTVTPNEAVARVGSETLTAQIAGVVVNVQNVPGQVFAPGTPVITMIDPTELRVVGTVDENKGLAKIKVGQPVVFTVDAFGSQTFEGVVDEIAPSANETGVTFTISDKRATKTFDIKVRYDTTRYTTFKNGMSAKMKIYTR